MHTATMNNLASHLRYVVPAGAVAAGLYLYHQQDSSLLARNWSSHNQHTLFKYAAHKNYPDLEQHKNHMLATYLTPAVRIDLITYLP